jgi:hypothetical protein
MSQPIARAGRDRASLYQEITDKIVAELGSGRVPWVQPWGTAAAKAPLAMPTNASSLRRYSGVNVLILWPAVIEHGFADFGVSAELEIDRRATAQWTLSRLVFDSAVLPR